MDEIINLSKKIALIGVVTAGLIVLGNVLADYLPWIWLTYFFVIIRHLAGLFSFLYDLQTLWTLVGWSYILLGAYWIFRGVLIIIKKMEKPL